MCTQFIGVVLSDPSLSQLIGDQAAVNASLQAEQGEMLSRLQQDIDDFQQSLCAVIDKGAQQLDSIESRRLLIETRITQLTEELQHQRIQYGENVNESSLQ